MAVLASECVTNGWYELIVLTFTDHQDLHLLLRFVEQLASVPGYRLKTEVSSPLVFASKAKSMYVVPDAPTEAACSSET